MSFIETRFPDDISFAAAGGPEFSTDIISTGGGKEYRNINWSDARIKYNVTHGVQNKTQLRELLAFFYARRGRAVGFRFKDWIDYEAKNQLLTTTDEHTVSCQLLKRYGTDQNAYVRKITKPVIDTVKIYFNNIARDHADYNVDYASGKITFRQVPSLGTKVTADFEFDVPVRFDNDQFVVSTDKDGMYNWRDIILIEVRL